MKKKKYLRMFSHCILVKGVVNCIICDLQRGDIYTFDNVLYDLLQGLLNSDYDSFISACDEETLEPVKKAITYLFDADILFFCDNPDNFIELPRQWDSPSKITNAIIEYSIENPEYSINDVINSLLKLGCKFFELRLLGDFNTTSLEKVVSLFDESIARGIYLKLEFTDLSDEGDALKILQLYPRIMSIIFHSLPKDVKTKRIKHEGRIQYSSLPLNNNLHCGEINSEHFQSNIDFFMESHFFNNCLNRKVSINKNGAIKNCPSMDTEFGVVQNTSIESVVNNSSFSVIWNLSKKDVNVCKTCEYRFVCNDCRAYLEKPDDIYSKPLKCGYDPSTGVWTDWATNPLKKASINLYGL